MLHYSMLGQYAQFLKTHKIIKVGKRLLRSSSPTISRSPPCPLTMSLSATSLCFLSTSRDGDCTISPGSLFQCLTTPSEKLFFLLSNVNLPLHNLRPLLLVLSSWHPTYFYTFNSLSLKNMEFSLAKLQFKYLL